MLLQTTASECGLACVASIAAEYGHEIELAELRARFSISLRGATLADLIEVSTLLGLSSRPLRLDLEELPQLSLPCVLHWDLNHFVVLTKVSGNRIVIHDPAVGERILSISEAGKHFTGIALELFPSEGFERRRAPPPLSWRQFFARVIGWKRNLAQMLVLAFALEIFALVSPFFVQWTVDEVIISSDRDLLTLLGLGFLLLLMVRTATEAARGLAGLALSTQLNVQSSSRVMGHLIRLPSKYFETRILGDIVSRFQALRSIQATVTGSLIETLLDGVFALVTAIIMLLYSPALSLAALAAAAIYAVLRIVRFKALRLASREHLVLAAKEQSHFIETLRGIQSVKIGRLESRRRARWLNLLVKANNREVATQRMALGFRAANSLLYGLESVAILCWGASLVMDNAMSVGMLMAFLAYKDSFSTRTSGFVDRFSDLRMVDLQTERLADIVLTPVEKTEGQQPLRLNGERIEVLTAGIELQGVGLRYGEREPWVWRNLSLTIRAGECVAIVGPSGCGKSSLAKLLLGLIPPVEGRIRIDGVPLSQFGIGNWRSAIGAVMQEDQLFSGSLQDNISGFDDCIDLERVCRAAQLAAIHNDIVAMPMGYHTLVGDMGSTLSGGQKQRVLLARAMYRQPAVLVLDEATSHLDGATERAINQAIAEARMTRIIIAHRQETIAMADRVIDLGKMRGLEPRLHQVLHPAEGPRKDLEGVA